MSVNAGALTPGGTGEPIDGRKRAKIARLIADVRQERYRWAPVRRVQLPQKHGQLRPRGSTTWPDKLLQAVMRSIRAAYYEPQCSNHAQGVRPKRGCHTALRAVVDGWTGTQWCIEGEIRGCCDAIDRTVLVQRLRAVNDN